MSPFPRRALRTAVTATALAATAASVTLAAPSAQAGVVNLGAKDSVVITLRGNGHGHGMSQYGAYGAAQQGLSYARILAFYYPGTTLTRLGRSTIRVRLSSLPSTLTVAVARTLTVSGVTGALPIAGVKRYRLVPAGTGFTLQQLGSAAGSTWRTYRAGLPARSEFQRSDTHSLRAYRSGGSARYYGGLRAVRSGAGAYTVNRVSLDDYTAGVVPSEMPTSWSAQAVDAQAVAARTYGRYAVEHPQNSNYDICDTTQCQVYGGRAQFDSRGRLMSTDYQAAAKATASRVLRYQGATIFAQFSASNGGYAADGGKPYLRAKADPYDSGEAANPYIDYKQTMSASALASYFGLARLTALAITRRDGNGAWGGRVTAATLTGTTSTGKAKKIDVSGDELQWAFGVGTTLFTVRRG